jgi:hypothetical protein
MKTRNGFVSNSSSSSFVVLKDAISDEQKDKILNYINWIDIFIERDEDNDNVDNIKEVFEYYDSDLWRIIEYNDYIFGETSMDNFSMYDYFNYINIDQDFVNWDDGYIDEPYDHQLKFIKKMKQEYRKRKINKINNL